MQANNLNDILTISIFGAVVQLKLWVILLVLAVIILLLLIYSVGRKSRQGQIKTKVTNFR